SGILSHSHFVRSLVLHPLFFSVKNIKEVVDMVSEMRRYKLRNVILHVLLDPIRHLRKALVTQIVIPFYDLDPRSFFCLLFNPFGYLFIRGSCRDERFELLRRYFRKTEEEVIEGTVEMVFAGGPGKCCAAFVQSAAGKNVSGESLPRTARDIFREIFCQNFQFVCVHKSCNPILSIGFLLFIRVLSESICHDPFSPLSPARPSEIAPVKVKNSPSLRRDSAELLEGSFRLGLQSWRRHLKQGGKGWSLRLRLRGNWDIIVRPSRLPPLLIVLVLVLELVLDV